jgi:hypothetical protein
MQNYANYSFSHSLDEELIGSLTMEEKEALILKPSHTF